MTRAICVAAALLSVSGCSAAIDRHLRHESAPFLVCPEEQVVISDYEGGVAGSKPVRWNASGCGQRRFCSLYVGSASLGDSQSGRVECRRFGE
jgi:hypothetical protein